MKTSWLIAGLGNPGNKYANTRHNIGFLFLDFLADKFRSNWQDKGNYSFCKFDLAEAQIVLIKPQQFMNRSGEAIAEYLNFFKIPCQQLVVIHDEVDLPFASIRIKKGGGNAGHNGLKSIESSIGSSDFCRIRLGVGRPEHPDFAMADWVLSNFSALEKSSFGSLMLNTEDALKCLISEGILKAQARFHR